MPESATLAEAAPPLARELLLTTRQMAAYVSDGIVVLEAVVPDELNRAVIAAWDAGTVLGPHCRYRGDRDLGTRPFDVALYGDSPLAAVFSLPRVRALIRSVIGSQPLFDHHATHVQAPGQGAGVWHGDAESELRECPDTLLMYFPHDTPRERGGAMVVPGSHLHTLRVGAPGRFDNYLGQRAMVCPAGTIAMVHPAIWHCGQPNRTALPRYMYKVRLSPGARERRTWNDDDLDHPEVRSILVRTQPWEHADHWVGVTQRLRWWRELTGDEGFDSGNWMWRNEHRPGGEPWRIPRRGEVRP